MSSVRDTPKLADLLSLGMIARSPSICPSDICLRPDRLGRAVLMVRDTVIISGSISSGDSTFTMAIRYAKKDDFDKGILPEIVDHLSKDHAYIFKRTWLGKYVLCKKDRYDMNIIMTPIKFKSLNSLLWAFVSGQRSLTGVFRTGSDSTIRLTVPDKKE